MKTPLLKRHLNPFLLVSTVLILSLLAGLSVLYQGQLNNVVTEKKELNQTLQDKNQRITRLQQEKSNLSTSLADTESDLKRYIDLYETEKDQRKTLEGEVSDLEEKVEDLEETGELVDGLNESLKLVCWSLDDKNKTTTISNQECSEWGHK